MYKIKQADCWMLLGCVVLYILPGLPGLARRQTARMHHFEWMGELNS
jgi:hypothetical protein